MPATATPLRFGWWWLLILTPALLHFWLLSRYAVNAPRLDDFVEILTFLPDWHQAVDRDAALAVLFRDYQNHRYVLYHGLLIAFDHINFRDATLAGNLVLPLLCAMMFWLTRTHPQRWTAWLCATWLVFNLQAWRAMFWGPLGTTNLLYPACALLVCWLMTRHARSVMVAGFFACVLTLSHGSGPLLFPVVALYLFHHHRALLLPWLLLTSVVFFLYFIVYPLQGDAGYHSQSTLDLLQTAITVPLRVISGFLALLGSHLLYNDVSALWKETCAVIMGLAECLLMFWLVRRGALRHYPVLLYWLLFLLLVNLSMAMGRSAYAGAAQAMQGHYKLLNSLWLWLLIVAVLQWVHERRPPIACRLPTHCLCAGLVVVLYIASWFFFLKPLQILQHDLITDAKQFRDTGKLHHPETVLYVKQPNKKMKAAIDGGFYDPAEP